MPMNGQTISQNLILTPEAQAILNEELGLFESGFTPAQIQQLMQILQRLGSAQPQTPQIQGLQSALAAPQLATAQAGADYGLPGRNIAANTRSLEANTPDYTAGLQALLEQIGTTQNTLIDPTLAQFLQPRVETTQPGPSTGASVLPAVLGGLELASNFTR